MNLDDTRILTNPKGIPFQSPGSRCTILKGWKPFSPGLRGTNYPGSTALETANPNGVVAPVCGRGRNPVGVEERCWQIPRVARPSQPWAGGLNPFGITGNPSTETCAT